MSVVRTTAVVLAYVCLLPMTWSWPDVGRNRSSTKRFRHGRVRSEGGGVCELEIVCKGPDDAHSLMMPVRLPIRGPRGPPGAPGTPGTGSTDCHQTCSTAEERKKVAFFVGLSENLGPISESTAVLFDRVITNVGSAYDAKSGYFTAPVNGTYQFTVVVSAQGRQKAAVMMVMNGEMVATVWAESIPYWASASNVAVLQLQKSDQVWLMLLSRASYLHGYMYTTFSGFLLFQ